MKISLNHLDTQKYDPRPGVAGGNAGAGRSSKAKRLKSELCADRAKPSAGREDSAGAGRVAPLGSIANKLTPPSSASAKRQISNEKRRQRFARRKRSAEILAGLFSDERTFEKISNKGGKQALIRKDSGELYADELEVTPQRPRPSKCGWALKSSVDIAVQDGHAHWQNIERCGSIHVCPHCASIIRAKRAEEIRQAVEEHQANGGSLLFLTLTIRHDHSDSLDTTLNAVLKSWTKLINGSPWARWKKRLQMFGYIRSLEVTISKANLWHPHLHALLFLDREVSDTELFAFTDWVYERWEKKVTGLGAQKPTREHGIQLVRVDKKGRALSKYLAKVQEEEIKNKSTWSVGAEMSRSDVKTGRAESLVPFQLLEHCEDFTREQRFHLWREYYLATKSRRAITWSRGLKDFFGIGEVTDEEIIENTTGGEVVFSTDASEYIQLMNRAPEMIALMLEYAELGKIDMIAKFLPSRWTRRGKRLRHYYTQNE